MNDNIVRLRHRLISDSSDVLNRSRFYFSFFVHTFYFVRVHTFYFVRVTNRAMKRVAIQNIENYLFLEGKMIDLIQYLAIG